MELVNVFSLILFALFLFSYSLKLVILNKKSGIKANVLGKGNKGTSVDSSEMFVKISTFVWGIAWLLESIFDNSIDNILPKLFTNEVMHYFGLMTITIGLLFFILSMITMKTSWRVGIDKETKTSLITNGLYKYSRNPAFVGFNLMFIGLFLTSPNLVTLIICLLNIVSIHNLILQEEKHLENMLKVEYLSYKNKTPRYLFFKST